MPIRRYSPPVVLAVLLAAACGCTRPAALSLDDLRNPGRITHLTPESAAALVKHVAGEQGGACILKLDGLRDISSASAAALALLPENSCLCLDKLPAISAEVAQKIAKARCHYVSLNGLTEIPDDVAQALAQYRGSPQYGGDLHLDGAKSVSNHGIAWLARATVPGLSLDGLEAISDEQAQALSQFQGRVLSLCSLVHASPAAIEALAGFRGRMLALNGLEAISIETAEALATFRGDSLFLEGLKDPPEGVRAALRGHQGLTVMLPESVPTPDDRQ